MESFIKKDFASNSIQEAAINLEILKKDKELIKKINNLIFTLCESIKNNNKVLFFGNGGSAGDSQHMAGEFVCRFLKDRSSLPGIALTTDTSVMTAISNDYGYEKIFSRQIEGLGNKKDIAFAFSTSGNSLNIISGLKKAKELGLITVGLSGLGGGEMKKYCDFIVEVPSKNTPRIQEMHILIGHIICDGVENIICGGKLC